VFTINRALYHYKPGFIIPTRNQHVVDVHAVVVNVFVASVLPTGLSQMQLQKP